MVQMFTERGADHSLLFGLHKALKLTVSPLRRLPLPDGGTKACRVCLNNPACAVRCSGIPSQSSRCSSAWFDCVCFQSVIRLWTLRKSSPRSSWRGATNLCKFSSHCNTRPFLSSSMLPSPSIFSLFFFHSWT